MEYTYGGKKFSAKIIQNITHTFINIDSKREITRTDRNDFVFYVIRDSKRNPEVAYICGKPESIKSFLTENNITKVEPFKGSLDSQSNSASSSGVVSSSLGSTSSIENSRREVPSNCVSGITLYTPKSKNVRDLPAEALKYLCPFNLNGLLGTTGEGRVISTIDGDTITMVIYLDLHGLSVGRQVTYERKKQIMAPALTENKDAGFFTAFRCRLYGIDSAEKNTEEGQLAKKIMLEKYTSLRGYVFYKIRAFDKYGRALVDLYEDSSYTHYINDLLLRYSDMQQPPSTVGGVNEVKRRILATPYFGGTKSELMTNLPTISTRGLKVAVHDTEGRKAIAESEEKESKEEKENKKEEEEIAVGKDKLPDDDLGDYLKLD